MKQAAMYVRVSTQQQKEGATIESQKALLLQYATEKGFKIIPEWIFEDNGVSGSTLARPALDRLRDLASDGLFNQIFVLSPDRLSRKYAYQAILLEEFRCHNVTITFQNSPSPVTATDHLLVQMQGMFAEYERAQITERSRRGKQHKAKNGSVSVFSHAPYGYRYIKGPEGLQSFAEIIDKEALVVKTIFDLYVKERLSIEKIRLVLLSKEIRSPQGNPEWSRSTINGILKNSTYRGIAIFGKTECGKHESISKRLPSRRVRVNGRRTAIKNVSVRDPKEWIEIPVPAIIENETFELAQDLLKKNKSQSTRNSKPGSLLQGLICCKECGYSFITSLSGKKTQGYNYYRCSKRDKKCSNRGLRTDILDEAVWKSLIAILKSPDLIQDEISRRMTDLEKAPVYQKQKILKERLQKLDLESNRLLDAYQQECIDLSELKKRMSEIKKEKNNISREIVEIDSGLSNKRFLEIKEAVEYFSAHLRSSEKELELEEKRHLLRMLIQDIQIGCDEITINHIVPIKKNISLEKIACLQTERRDGETQRRI